VCVHVAYVCTVLLSVWSLVCESVTGKACGFWKRRHGGNEGNCYPFVKVHGSESHTYVYELSLLWHTAFFESNGL
jgi:hypothetical protein